MFKTRLLLLRGFVVCVFIFGLSTGLVFPANDAYSRTSLSELEARIEALEVLSSINNNIVYVMPGQTIQEVINSIDDVCESNPYTVIIPPGDFLLEETLYVPGGTYGYGLNYISLQGAGMDLSRIYMEAGDQNMIRPGKGFYLKDLTIECTAETVTKKIIAGHWNDEFYGVKASNCRFKTRGWIAAGPNSGGIAENLKSIFWNCIFEGGEDMFWLTGHDAISEGVYIFINPIVNFNTNNGRIFVSLKKSFVKVDVFSPRITGTTNKICRPFKLTAGTLNIYNPRIDVNSTGRVVEGIHTRDDVTEEGTVNIFGGSIETNGGTDIYVGNPDISTVNVYGTKYNTSVGVIGGYGKFNLGTLVSAPTNPNEGDMYVNSGDHHVYFYNSIDWVQLDN